MTPDMADAHATARARDTRASTVTYEVRIDTSGFQRAIDRMAEQVRETAPTRREAIQRAARAFTYCTRTHAIDPDTGELTPLTQEPDMTKTDRHDELVALLNKISEESVTTSNVLADMLDLLRDRLPDPEGVKDDPAPADDLPGEPVEPGDLRAGDRVEYDFEGLRSAGTLVGDRFGLRSDTPDADGCCFPSVVSGSEWCQGISDVRLIERAPREGEGSDEARVCYSDECGEPCQSKQERDRDEIARLGTQIGLLSHRLGVERKSRKKVKAERDALRERLDALREDVERFSAGDPLITPLDILARDDERAAKGGQR